MASISWIGKGIAKLAVGAGVVYVSIDQGVWGSSSNGGARALQNIKSTVMPSLNDYLIKVPTVEEIIYSTKATWNSGVKKTFNAIVDLPDTTTRALKSSIDLINSDSKK